MAEKAPSETVPLLQPKLDSMAARSLKRASAEKVAINTKAFADLEDSGILERALNVGDTIPNFALPSATGDTVGMQQLLAGGPVVVVWYRGGWCPYCNVTLAAWRAQLDEVTKQGARLVAITPELPDKAMTTKEKHELEFEVLSDIDNEVARQFGIVFKLADPIAKSYGRFFSFEEYYGNEDKELPLSTTYVIDPDGVIRYAFLEVDYKKRAEPGDVIEVLRMIGAEK
jgi:peroxiredoxin